MHTRPAALPFAAVITFVLSVGACVKEAHAVGGTLQNGIRTVALSSDTFPGVPSDVSIEQFGEPAVDSLGRVAFKANLRPSATPGLAAMWSESAPGVLDFVARDRSPIPGLNYRFTQIIWGDGGRMSAGGDVYFAAGIVSTTSSDSGSGIFRFSPGAGLSTLVTSSPVAPGIPSVGPGGSVSSFLDFNETGDLAFASGSGLGPIWTLHAAGLSQVSPGGASPVINDRGDVAFRLNTRIDVWDRNARSLRTVAAENGIAPGTGGAVFRPLGEQRSFTNADGVVTFVGQIAGTGVNNQNDIGIWTETTPGGPLMLALREGQNAVGVEPGVVWSGIHEFSRPATFGRTGGVALRLPLAGPGVVENNDSGVWAGPSISELHLVARKGQPAPGTEPGLVFSQFEQSGTTADGRAVFTAFLSGSGLDPMRDRGIWAEDAQGVLRLIARRGDLVQLPSGELVAMTSVLFDPEWSIGDRGHVGFITTLANGHQGVHVSLVAAVPEPGLLTQIAVVVLFGAQTHACRRRTVLPPIDADK